MIYSFQCPAGYVLDISSSGLTQCFDGAAYTPVTSVLAVTVQPVGVDPQTGFTDGMALGWGVAAAMAVAWSIHVLRRAIL